MAYDAVISLILTLKQLVRLKPHWISDETRKMVDSVLESLEYFQDFLENTSKRRQDCGKVEELEREMKSAVNEAEDAIELKIYEIHKLEKGNNAREALCEILSLLVEKIDDMKRNVMGSSFGTNEVQGYSNPTNEDLQTGYVAKLNPESVVVGLEDDLMRIIRRLKGSMSTREIIPILGMGGIGKTTLAKMA
ncbi:hypothetical protein KY284_029906 [Solanum tuberosum]|nr:hypothetical protein KY284_029906 [Solanum tuberosum]